jgi:shikimate dehydrogenase
MVHRAAVLGQPIAHSLSPVLHGAAYRALGLDDWTYEAVECGEQDLPRVLNGGWAGLSLTMPLKRAVLPLLDHVEPLAAEVGGANTVVFAAGGRRYGYNTDVHGMLAALAEAGADKPDSATIVGAGATACAALAALRELGLTEVVALARDRARAGDLLAAALRLGVDVDVRPLTAGVRDGDLLISTVPVGAADFLAERTVVPPAEPSAVLDVVYAPWPTRLALAATEAGVPVASGASMLLHQAARQFELMTGHEPAPLAAMRAALVLRLGWCNSRRGRDSRPVLPSGRNDPVRLRDRAVRSRPS